MSIKNRIRKWLGINELIQGNKDLNEEVFKLRNQLIVTFNDEMSPKRHEASKELTKRMEQKLLAEDLARKHTLGEI